MQVPWAVVILAVFAIAAISVVVWNPRHRTFDLGVPPRPRATHVPAPATGEAGAATASRSQPATVASAVAVSTAARLDVPLVLTSSGTAATDVAPRGWALRTFAGRPDVAVVRTDGRIAMRLTSERSSFAVYRDLVIDLAELPVLSWSWKVTRLPRDGDARRAERDDQAAQLYVAFPRWPSPLKRSDVVGYVWDTTAPVGTTIASTKAGNVRLIVVESGPERLGSWQRYRRDVSDDYAALYGKKPPRVGHLALMTDADDTRSDAEAFVSAISFAGHR